MSAIAPTITNLNRPFWEGCHKGVLVVQRCDACGHLRYPISPVCPSCWSFAFSWTPVSGRGEVRSCITFRHSYNEAWRDSLPYVVALVGLEEGPVMLSDIVCNEPADVHVGAPVTVQFQRVDDELTVPKFTLADEEPKR